jgi:hypothetical protein
MKASAAIVAASIVASASLCRAECIRIWKDIPDAKRLAAVVFSGAVVEVKKSDLDGVFVTFAVDRVWKGPRQRRLVLPLYMTLDSVNFVKGESYVVFASRHVMSESLPSSMRVPTVMEPVFDVLICSPTKPLREAQATLVQLGRAARP